MTITLNGSTGITTPAVTNEGAYTGDGVVFADGTPANTLVTTTDGNVGVGTSSPAFQLHLSGTEPRLQMTDTDTGANSYVSAASANGSLFFAADEDNTVASSVMTFRVDGTERMRILPDGDFIVGATAYTGSSSTVSGGGFQQNGGCFATVSDASAAIFNRITNDGTVVLIRQAGTTEGTISVSGTTVSYNGGHLARWSQLLDGSKDESLLKGTVLSNLDEMCVWEKDGVVAENEQLNKMKVSDVEGDTNVAGVFVNWTTDEDYNSDDMNIAMTGDMIIRIAEGVTVQRGDLLMSAGDGTAKPQGDDIVRSKTIAKVTSTNITCTYADGSYCVPCVLMAC